MEQPVSYSAFEILGFDKVRRIFVAFKASSSFPLQTLLTNQKSENSPGVALFDGRGKYFSFIWVHRLL